MTEGEFGECCHGAIISLTILFDDSSIMSQTILVDRVAGLVVCDFESVELFLAVLICIDSVSDHNCAQAQISATRVHMDGMIFYSCSG